MSQEQNLLTPYLARLATRSPISQEAQDAFLAIPYRQQTFAIYRDIVREGEATDWCCLVVEGMVSRYKSLRSGGRQIVSFHLPGDMIDLSSCLVKVSDHSIRTHAPTTIVSLAASDVLAVASNFPELALAFWFDTLVDAAIFREWTLNVGRRSARERVAHLLLEFAYRLNAVGIGDGRTFQLPVTQADFADATGLSPVHVNRSLKSLRLEGLIRMVGKSVTIDQPELLARDAEFTTLYLHPEGSRLPK